MRIIPAIDIINGKCVRLTQGDYSKKTVYNEDPLTVANMFQDAGLEYLHLVDLDGAKHGRVVNWEVVTNIVKGTNLIVDFGGGVKTPEDIHRLFDVGIAQVNVGSVAVKDPGLVGGWIEEYGDKNILSADVKDERVRIQGWQDDAEVNLMDFLQSYVNTGIETVVCTDISVDGMLAGPNHKLYKRITDRFTSIKLIASGGIRSVTDLVTLRETGVFGAIIGKAIYEGKLSTKDLANF